MSALRLSITTDQALSYMGIDYADDMTLKNIERCIRTADSYLKGSIHQDYPGDDPRAVELGLLIISDLYDNRGLYDTVSGNVRKLVDDLSLQLRLEMRRVE